MARCDDVAMRAEAVSGEQCQVTLGDAEVVALHELLSRSEWAGLFDDPLDPVEVNVISDFQQVLVPFVRGLGTDAYGQVVDEAWAQLRLEATGESG